MKFTTTLSLAVAPVALAKSVRNKYPVKRNPTFGGGGLGEFGGGFGGFGGGVNVVQQKEVIILLWGYPGGQSQTTTFGQAIPVAQTVAVPAGGVPTELAGLDGVTTTIQPGATGVVEGVGGATHSVIVGGEQGLQFFPQEVKAKQGDTVIFEFYSQNHTVTQSTFDAPCDILAGGMDSNYMANPNNTIVPAPQIAMQVMTEEPLWMFCKQGNHCGRGMVFSINANAEKTHAQYQANAIKQRGEGLQGSALTGGPGPAPAAPPAGAPPADVPPAPVGGEAPPPDANAAVPLDPLASPTLGGGLEPTPAAVGGAIGGNGVVQGLGTVLPDGSCMCAVQCGGVAGFPDAASQGIGAFGGTAGAISMDALGGIVAAPAAPAPPVGSPESGATPLESGSVSSDAALATQSPDVSAGGVNIQTIADPAASPPPARLRR